MPGPSKVSAGKSAAGNSVRMTKTEHSNSQRGPKGLLALQATAGNQAVLGLVRSLQRAPGGSGWADADKSGKAWNASAHVESGYHRLPIDGLPLGNQKDVSGDHGLDWKGRGDNGKNEQEKTTESAAGRAIVLVPTNFDPKKPAKVMLHLHGFTSRVVDPYAGWRQSAKDATVRDVTHDRIEAQLQSVKDSQLIGILPQGVGHSEFGKDVLVPAPYVAEVMRSLAKVAAKDGVALPDLSGGYQLVLSAHSGGGATIAKALDAEVADAKRKAGKAADPDVKPAAEVILFEALYGDSQSDSVWHWAEFHLTRALAAIKSASTVVGQILAIAGCPNLRAYRGSSPDAKGKAAYDRLDRNISGWFKTHGGELGAAEGPLRQHFQVIVLSGVEHETSVRGLGDDPAAGPMADALNAVSNPGQASKLVTKIDKKTGRATRIRVPDNTRTGAKTPAPAVAPQKPAATGGPAPAARTTTTTAVGPTTAPAAVRTPAAGRDGPSGFILDVTRDTLEKLKPAVRAKFEAITWVDLDYPGAKMKVKDTSEENLAKWRNDTNYVLYPVETKKVSNWYIKGAHQKEADELLLALSRVRPGGGERRANTGDNAVLTKSQYKADPERMDAYIAGQLTDVTSYAAGSSTKTTTRQLNKHAAAQFAAMLAAAASDGVYISINNSFRDRGKAEANAKKADNAKAVASFSSHSLGLAVDLNLWTASMGARGSEVGTAMHNILSLLHSPAYKWIYEKGADYGFYQYRREPWHWEYNPEGFREKFWAEAEPDLAPAVPDHTAPKKKAG